MRKKLLPAAYIALVTLTLLRCASTPTPKTNAEINLTDLLQKARIVPYPDESRREGLLVQDLEKDSDWSRAGLKKGDIVIRVGDKELVDTAASMDLIRAVANPGSERIEVLRKRAGRIEHIFLPPDPGTESS